MGRSTKKPFYVSRISQRPLKMYCGGNVGLFNFLAKRFYCINKIFPLKNWTFLISLLLKYKLKYNNSIIYTPVDRDTILRFYYKFRSWGIWSYGFIADRSDDEEVELFEGGIVYFTTYKEAVGQKYGEFRETRTFSDYRSVVDSKKIDKVQRDMIKQAKRVEHQKREEAHLFKKAIQGAKSGKGKSKRSKK